MPVQFQKWLSMAGLGIQNDIPADALQPPLVDGIHLRWQFGGGRGFPWHGYYLFRRPHEEDKPRCARGRFRALATNFLGAPLGGALGSLQHDIPEGVFTSNKPLIVTDDFPAPHFAELDLRDRNYLNYQFAESARKVRSEIGFREQGNGYTCIRFTQPQFATHLASPTQPAPRVVDGASIQTFDFDGKPEPTTTLRQFGPAFLLEMDAGAVIDLPCPSDSVVMAFVNGTPVGSAQARNDFGDVVDQTDMPEPENGLTIVQLTGDGITQVVLDFPQNEANLLAMCWHCSDQDKPDNPRDVEIEYLAGATVIHREIVSGNPGAVVATEFSSDLVTGVRYLRADAALVEVCYTPVSGALRRGWEPVPDVQQPIALPVRDPQYPANGGLANNVAASQNEALNRVTYGDATPWQGQRFADIHAAMKEMVDQGKAGPAMRNVGDTDVPGIPDVPSPQEQPTMNTVRPMNYLMMASLYPQISQMLGLYWADQTAQPGQHYDYMVVADHTGVSNGTAQGMLAYLLGPNPDLWLIDTWVCYDLVRQAQLPLDQPQNLNVYALPGSTKEKPDGTLSDSENNAGLHWDIPELAEGILSSKAPVLYWIRRADLGDNEPNGAVTEGEHQPVTERPHAVTEPNLPTGVANAERSDDWPPLSLHYIDGGLKEGWYSYRVNSIDLFGRWSPASDPAAWQQWAPAPASLPWYFDPNQGDAVVNANAISLLDKTAPPPPTAVEAFALDPNDSYLDRDARYATWFASLSAQERTDTVGLRVRWLWSFAQMRTAPDTREFRVYLSPGLPNNFKGRITDVVPAGAGKSRVTTDIPNTHANGAWAGAILRSGARSFQVTGSLAGANLTLDVDNLSTAQDEVPVISLRCNVSLPGGANATHPLAQDMSAPTRWDERIWVVDVNDHVAQGVVPDRTPDGDTLAGSAATAAGAVVTLPAGTDISAVAPLNTHIFLADDTARASKLYRIMTVDAATRQVNLDAAPALVPANSDWEIGTMVSRYEVFLPFDGDAGRDGLDLATSRADPVAYAQVGVTAVDDKLHTDDAPKWNGTRWEDRPGNEGAIGGPATVYKVHRTPPPAPRVPADADAVFASMPDYQRKSFYTVRWEPEADVMTHVFRAVDATLFDRDWAIRDTRGNLSFADHDTYFPDGWAAGRRTAAAAALNAIDAQGDYAGLSGDALDVLGRLPGNEGFASAGGVTSRDWLIRRTRTALSEGDAAYYPDDWNDVLVRQTAADMLNAIGSRADYDDLSNTSLRVLAGLPGLETVYQQITDLPLLNAGGTTANLAGPDNAPGYVVDPALRAFVDGLEGRARNRYFYRTAFIDEAQNQGQMGLASPPVNIRNVAPPRAPVFIRALAGDPDGAAMQDRKIALAWASNREPDLTSYRLYRTDDPAKARKTRLMDFVAEINVPAGDPAARPAEVVYLDDPVPGLVTFTYRLEAVDNAGNRSNASDPIVARAFDLGLPEIPELTVAWVENAGIIRAQLSWVTEHEIMVQRQEIGGPWIDLAQWREAGNMTIRDPFSQPTETLNYRLLVRKYTGARARGDATVLDPMAP